MCLRVYVSIMRIGCEEVSNKLTRANYESVGVECVEESGVEWHRVE